MKPASHRTADTCLSCKFCWSARGHMFCVKGDSVANQSGSDIYTADFDFNGQSVQAMGDGEFESLWVSRSVTNYETCDDFEPDQEHGNEQ